MISLLAQAESIVLRDGSDTFKGTYNRLGDDGGLIVNLLGGGQHTFYSAEIVELIEREAWGSIHARIGTQSTRTIRSQQQANSRMRLEMPIYSQKSQP